MQRLLRVPFLAACIFAAVSLFAEGPLPTGFWKTIDDKTQKPKSVVEIYPAEDGTIEGRVVKILDTTHGTDPLCRECPGERKGQPVMGMVIMWDLERDGDRWSGGRILDPKKGKIYKAKLELTDEGKLEVRGYMGISLFGRTQTWLPVDQHGNELGES